MMHYDSLYDILCLGGDFLDKIDNVPVRKIAEKLTEIEWDILSYLNRMEDVPFEEIKKLMKAAVPKTYQSIRKLEGGLLIDSRTDARDSRTRFYNITEYGIAALAFRK